MTSSITNLGANAARRYIDMNAEKANIATQQLASGSNVFNPTVDPSSAAVGYGLSSNIQSLQQAQRNVSQAISMMQSISGFLDASEQALSRMQQLTAASNSDTVQDAQRGMMNQEFQRLLQQVDLNSKNARWSGVSMLSGGVGAVTAQAAVVAAPTVAGGATTAGTYFDALSTTFTAASTQGYVNGSVTNASVTANGAQYDVSITVGNQVFQGTTSGAAASLMLLTSTTDNGNVIALTSTTSFVGIAAATVQSDLQTQLGIGTGLNAVFSSVNTTAGGMTGVAFTAGSGTTAGGWGLTYTVNGTQGTFKISNGLEQYTTSVTTGASLTQNVTFNNGVSLGLTAFDGTASIAQNIYSVASGSSIAQTFQYGELSTDTLSVSFTGAGIAALGIAGTSIATQSGAAIASNLIKVAQDSLGNQIATLGGAASQLKFMTDTLRVNIENTQAALSTFTDADIASSMQNLQTFNGLGQIAQSVFTKALNDQSNLVQMVQSVR